jgi:hypothetical protein
MDVIYHLSLTIERPWYENEDAKTRLIVLYKGMDMEQDLSTASREALLAIISEQKTTIAQLEQRVAGLETRMKGRGSPGMPGNKSGSRQQPPGKTTRKRRAHGFARVRMVPTRREVSSKSV